jgi:hypothetical protein
VPDPDENEELRARLAQTEERLRNLEAAQKKEPDLEAAPKKPNAIPIAVPLPRTFVRREMLRAKLYALLIAFVVVAGFGVGLAPTCLGGLGRSTAPVVCPKGYDHSFTRQWSTVQGATVNQQWEVHCVMPDGSEQTASSWLAIPTLAFYFAIPFIVAAAYVIAKSRSSRATRSST